MNNLAPTILDMFTPRVNNPNLRNFQDLQERKKTVKCVLKTATYYCLQLWILESDTKKTHLH